jgi:hypothetical protein
MIGGIIPLILVPLLLVLLPESLAFLILQKRPQAEILRPLQRLAPELDMTTTTRFIVQEETGRGVPVKHLFTSGRAMPTAPFWLLFFLALMITYLPANWMPIAFNSAGVPVTLAVSATGMWQVGAIIGTLGVGQLMDRFDPFRVVACGFLIAACAVLLMTQVGGAVAAPLVLGIMLFCGICGRVRWDAKRERPGRLVLSGFHPLDGTRLGDRYGAAWLDLWIAPGRTFSQPALATAHHLPGRFGCACSGRGNRLGDRLL